jgi:hypothetical protein
MQCITSARVKARIVNERTLKERNTQRRKRRRTVEFKAAEIAELCDFDVSLIMRNRESGEYYTFKSSDLWRPNMEDIVRPYLFLYCTTSSNDCQLAYLKSQNKLPRDIEKLNKKKERRRSRRAKRRVSSEELLSEDQALNEDESDGQVTRAASFLPEPPSFDATILRKACVDYVEEWDEL